MTYPGIVLDRRYFQGGAWDDYAQVARWAWAEDAKRLADVADLQGKRVGILGCAYGFSVYHLRRLGIEAYGVDVSSFAVREFPPAGRWLVLADATTDEGIDAFAERVGGFFDVLVDENLLPLLSDAEARRACTLWRMYAAEVVHLLTMCREPPRVYNPAIERPGARHNWHSLSEWRGIIGDMDRLIDFRDWSEHE
jgi:hypothetical protein